MNRQKAIFIVYNSALHGLVLRTLEQHNAKGYTEWSEVYGRGSATGEPHLGSHAWPTTNGAMMRLLHILSERSIAYLADY